MSSIQPNNGKCIVLDTVQAAKSVTYACAQFQTFRGGGGALMFLQCGKDGDITVPINPNLQ
jgi:hypothetical protein